MYNDYKSSMSANQVVGTEFSLDDSGRHFLKFNAKNEVSIETEPLMVKKKRFQMNKNNKRWTSYSR